MPKEPLSDVCRHARTPARPRARHCSLVQVVGGRGRGGEHAKSLEDVSHISKNMYHIQAKGMRFPTKSTTTRA